VPASDLEIFGAQMSAAIQGVQNQVTEIIRACENQKVTSFSVCMETNIQLQKLSNDWKQLLLNQIQERNRLSPQQQILTPEQMQQQMQQPILYSPPTPEQVQYYAQSAQAVDHALAAYQSALVSQLVNQVAALNQVEANVVTAANAKVQQIYAFAAAYAQAYQQQQIQAAQAYQSYSPGPVAYSQTLVYDESAPRACRPAGPARPRGRPRRRRYVLTDGGTRRR